MSVWWVATRRILCVLLGSVWWLTLWVIWDIAVIAYLINKNWFTSEDLSCPNIKDDTSYELTDDRHKITMVNYIDVNKVYTDLFKKLGDK